MAPVALALCGKSPVHIEGLSNNLAAQGYDIIHVCRELTAALSELPALLGGETPTPSSGFGSNAIATTKTPGSTVRGIVIGGGYSPDDVEQIKKACDPTKPVAFFRADTTKPRPADAPPGPPPVEEITKRVLASFEAATEEGKEGWAPGVYLF